MVSCRQLLPCYRPSIKLAKENLGFPTEAQANQRGSKLMCKETEVAQSHEKNMEKTFLLLHDWAVTHEKGVLVYTYSHCRPWLGLESREGLPPALEREFERTRKALLKAQTGTQLVTPAGVRGVSLPYVTLSPPPSGHRAIWSHSEMCQTPAHILAEAKG